MKVKKFLIAVLNETLDRSANAANTTRTHRRGLRDSPHGFGSCPRMAAADARRRETGHEDQLLRRQTLIASRPSISPNRKAIPDERYATDHIYRTFLRLTRRLSNSQIMMLLAVSSACSPDWAPICSKCCCTASRAADQLVPGGQLHIPVPDLPRHRHHTGDAVRQIHRARQYFGGRHARALRHVEPQSRIRGHNCWTSIVGGATTIGFGGSVGPRRRSY